MQGILSTTSILIRNLFRKESWFTMLRYLLRSILRVYVFVQAWLIYTTRPTVLFIVDTSIFTQLLTSYYLLWLWIWFLKWKILHFLFFMTINVCWAISRASGTRWYFPIYFLLWIVSGCDFGLNLFILIFVDWRRSYMMEIIHL